MTIREYLIVSIFIYIYFGGIWKAEGCLNLIIKGTLLVMGVLGVVLLCGIK